MPAVTSVAIIGLGSRGLGVLERVLALAGDDGPPLEVVVIDPDPTGAGVHVRQQPDYLLLNTICCQVTMFPDEHSVGDGFGAPVVRSGPNLYEWVTERELRIAADGYSLGEVGRPVRPTDFLPRRILGDYLAWVFDQLRAGLPGRVRLTVHQASATELAGAPDGPLQITLDDATVLLADRVFLTTGYTGNRAGPAATDRLIDLPYPMPDRLNRIQPGELVAVGGFGLSAMDAMSCLTVGRGGRYLDQDGELTYQPSGEEPRLLFYSRSGLPCRARPRVLEYGPKYQPLVFTHANIDTLRAEHGRSLDFQAMIWPLILEEARIAYRRWQARIEGWPAELEQRLGVAARDGRIGELLAELDVEHGAFDPSPLLDPSASMALSDAASYQDWLIGTVSDDLAEGELGLVDSPVKASLDILRDLRDTFRYAIDFGGLTSDSLDDFLRSWVPLINRAVVGPQFERHVELLALLRAGLAQVPLGPNPSISWEADSVSWRLRSSRLAEVAEVRADWLLQGRHDLPSVAESTSPLLDSLYRTGRIRPRQAGSRNVVGIDIDPDQHPIDAAGRPDQRIWVLGPLCEGATFYNNLVPSPGAFSRPFHDAHRCVAELFAERDEPAAAVADERPDTVALAGAVLPV